MFVLDYCNRKREDFIRSSTIFFNTLLSIGFTLFSTFFFNWLPSLLIYSFITVPLPNCVCSSGVLLVSPPLYLFLFHFILSCFAFTKVFTVYHVSFFFFLFLFSLELLYLDF